MAEERMLNDEILLGLIKANSGGGGGGTTDYSDLSNKPQINGVTLSGNKSASDLGLATTTDLAGKQDALTFDDTPTDNSNNPVKSNGVYDALATKQNATDNNLTTTSKTVVGAVNELKSGLTNVQDNVKLNTQDLTTPSRTANIAISTSSDSTDVSQYSVALYVDCDLKPNTTYTLSFDGTNGARYYTNENLFASQSTVTVGSDRAVLTVTTKSTISKAGNTYTSGKGWIILKNSITEPAGHAFTDVQFEIGSSATPYSVYTPSVETRLDAMENLIIKTSETVQTNVNGTGRLSITFDQARLVYVAAVTISATIAIPFLTGDHTWAVKVMEADDLAPVQDGVLIAYGYIVNS